MNGTAIASTPSFAGSNPAEVTRRRREGQAHARPAGGYRALAGHGTRRVAAHHGGLSTTAPNEILTDNTLDIDPLSPAGLKASAMTPRSAIC